MGYIGLMRMVLMGDCIVRFGFSAAEHISPP